MKETVIIDTDPGIDDALAILLAIESKYFDIKLITTVAGNTTLNNATRNARYIINLTGKNGIPLASGERKPIRKKLKTSNVHGESGLGNIILKNNNKERGGGVNEIIKTIKRNDNITLVTLGPLTNIALAIEKEKNILKKISRIVMMGGAVDVSGNSTRASEFNFFTDPEAAKIIFDSPLNKTIIPLDVCNKVRFKMKDFEAIKQSKYYETILKMIGFYSNIKKSDYNKEIGMYDVLTIYYLINPSAFKAKYEDIKIETKGSFTEGMTVVDRRKFKRKNNTTVAVDVDKNLFQDYFFKTLR